MGGSSSLDDINRQMDEDFNATINKIKNGADDMKNNTVDGVRNSANK